jgi:hypothetical protein
MKDFKDRLNEITERNKSKLTPPPAGHGWPMEKRAEVVGQYLILGNLKMVAALTDMPYNTLRKWRYEPWWPEMVAELRATQNIKMDASLTELVELSLAAAYDRIVNGDYIYDQKSGEIRRKPAALRDIHRVAVDLLGKREFLRDRSEDRQEDSKVTIEEHLKLMAKEMAKWVDTKKKEVVDVESIEILEDISDAVHEEREAGLQEGERAVQQPPGYYKKT